MYILLSAHLLIILALIVVIIDNHNLIKDMKHEKD